MPGLGEASAAPFAKIFLIGDTKTGKTAALKSLVDLGLHLHILDTDCKLVPSYFQQLILADDPRKLDLVDFVQYRDEYENNQSDGSIPKAPAVGYTRCTAAATKWIDGSKPFEWGPEHVFVVDTLNTLSTLAFNQAYFLVKNNTRNTQVNDYRQVYKGAQNAIERFIGGLWSEKFATNVVVLSHIKDVDLEWKIDPKTGEKIPTVTKGFPATVGSALSQTIGAYTNELFQMEVIGYGGAEKRIIRTVTNDRTQLGSALIGLPKELPAATGLAEIFSRLRGIK